MGTRGVTRVTGLGSVRSIQNGGFPMLPGSWHISTNPCALPTSCSLQISIPVVEIGQEAHTHLMRECNLQWSGIVAQLERNVPLTFMQQRHRRGIVTSCGVTGRCKSTCTHLWKWRSCLEEVDLGAEMQVLYMKELLWVVSCNMVVKRGMGVWLLPRNRWEVSCSGCRVYQHDGNRWWFGKQ